MLNFYLIYDHAVDEEITNWNLYLDQAIGEFRFSRVVIRTVQKPVASCLLKITVWHLKTEETKMKLLIFTVLVILSFALARDPRACLDCESNCDFLPTSTLKRFCRQQCETECPRYASLGDAVAREFYHKLVALSDKNDCEQQCKSRCAWTDYNDAQWHECHDLCVDVCNHGGLRN
jgi:hypothetical protein